ncbi:AraC family transcriptional regulator [uncultured Trichococcus sp.]|uniref:AraC family transcriptional regulator n=1 Tax=uncultured Trichococcus sp. TaxID=189665 RepID=UPI0029C929C7|nr:AraC family transcriptional regulator [uncultured Trichococcus sp.]
MNEKQQILETIYDYFSFPASSVNENIPFSSSDQQDINLSIYTLETVNSYQLYDFNSPFKLSLIDHHGDFSSYLFTDMVTSIFSNNQTNEDTSSQLHKHNFFELIYVIDGQIDFRIEDTHRRYHAGDACIINSNVKHVELRNSQCTVLYLNFKPEFYKNLNLYFQESNDQPTELSNFFKRNEHSTQRIDYIDFFPVPSAIRDPSQESLQVLFHLIEELLFKRAGYQDIVTGYIKRLFSFLQTPSTYSCSNTQFQILESQSLFERTLSYLYNNKRKVSRAELAEELHYNGNYISHVFQKHTGQTLASYIRNNYLNEASNLLLNTTMSITDIIKKLGFENRTAFYNQFKNKFGVTPQIYRNSIEKKR